MYEFIYTTVQSSKYIGIGVLMAVFPAEAVMPFVGYTSSQGAFVLPLAIAVGVTGSVLGSTIVYLIARSLSKRAVNRLVKKYGKWLGITPATIKRAGSMFDAHARSTVFFGRFVPGVRTAVSIPAGYQGMALPQFVFYTTLGSGISAVGLALAGYYTRENLARTQDVAGIVTNIIGGVVVLVAGVWLYRHYLKNPTRH
jgi:membrane protein DedA with SNARE-associated domain